MMVRSRRQRTGQRSIRRSTRLWSLSCGLLVSCGWLTSVAPAQAPRHPLDSTQTQPPGTIAQQQLLRGGPRRGYFQPVHVRVPEGATVALGTEEGFAQVHSGEFLAGLQIGPVYRLRVTDIPFMDGVRLYPTIELIDRLYPPPGYANRFPIVIELTKDDLTRAAEGTLVTRVVYLENPQTPIPHTLPYRESQPYFDVLPHEDPLHVADELGRPMAIIRIGSRTLENDDAGSCDLGFAPAPSLMLDINEVHQPPENVVDTFPSLAVPPHQSEAAPQELPGAAQPQAAPVEVPLETPLIPTPDQSVMPNDVGQTSPIVARPVPHIRRKITR